MDFYTSVQCIGNNILYRGIQGGKRIKSRIKYTPSLFLPSKKVTHHTNLQGEYLDEKVFGSIRDARDYVKGFENVDGAPKIYGQTKYDYAWIAERHPEPVEYDQSKIQIALLDIEVGSENGFPDPYDAVEPITAITIQSLDGTPTTFGCGEYGAKDGEYYVHCQNEHSLLKKFLSIWTKSYPDIVTGWNSKFFDIPYLFNRIKKVLSEEEAKSLSPWGYISERKAYSGSQQLVAYEIAGVAHLDYLELYKWYAPEGKSQESYKLNSIAVIELGEGKISYDEYDSLHLLYLNDYQKFIEYNIRDVDIIKRLEDKLKLLELATTLAYYCKCNFEDVFAQTRMWDSLTYGYLKKRGIIVPPKNYVGKDSMFEGAYVKPTQTGLFNWVASFDLNSLYSHLMMQYNISPETILPTNSYDQAMYNISMAGVTVDKMLKKEIDTSKLTNCCLAPNGQFFRTDIRGFLPKLLEEMYEDRKVAKKKMLANKQFLEDLVPGTPGYDKAKKDLEALVAKYNNLQLAMKVTLNSAYGALGSAYFRFYDLRMATAVTLSGQLSIRWIECRLNEFMNKILKTNEDYVIAADTDSIYLKLGPLIEKVYGDKLPGSKVIDFMDRFCEQEIQPFITENYKELAEYVHAYEQKMEMKRESLASKGIWTSKKHYILDVYNSEGVSYKEPQMKVVGLEMVKSSTPSAIRTKMKDAIKIMLRGNEVDLHKFIEEFRVEFKELEPEDISFPRGMNGMSEYMDPVTLYKKGTPIHTKGAILYNHNLKLLKLDKKYQMIQEGEKLKFTYLKMPNPFQNTVVSFPVRLPKEFGLRNYIDYDTQFEKSFLKPMQGILDCMGWTTAKVDSLEGFFG